MEQINYDNLSQAELIKLIKERDLTIQSQENEIAEIQEKFSDFKSNTFSYASIDDIEVGSFEDIDFSSLTVENDDYDNSREVNSAEKIHSDNASAFKSLQDSIYSSRKALFINAIDNWIADYNKGEAEDLGNSSVGIMNRLEVEYNDYKFVNTQLSKLVGKISFNEFNNHLQLRDTVSIYGEAYKSHSNGGVFKEGTDKVQKSIEFLITHLLNKEEFKLGAFSSSCKTFEEKEKALQSYFPKNDFLLSYKAYKEKTELEKIIHQTEKMTNKSTKRL